MSQKGNHIIFLYWHLDISDKLGIRDDHLFHLVNPQIFNEKKQSISIDVEIRNCLIHNHILMCHSNCSGTIPPGHPGGLSKKWV